MCNFKNHFTFFNHTTIHIFTTLYTMIKTLLTLIIMLTGTFSFSNTTISASQIKGTINNPSFETISINTINDRVINSATVDAEGHFTFDFSFEESFYLLEYGRESIYIHLGGKDRLEVYFDASDLEGSIKFKGVGAIKNNYLLKKAQLSQDVKSDVKKFYDVDEDKFLENIRVLKARLQKELSNYNVAKSFVEQEEKSLYFQYLLSIQNFKNTYKYNLGKEITPSKLFYKELEGLALNDMSDYKTQPYYYYLVNSIWSARIEEENSFQKKELKFRQIKDNEVLNDVFVGFYSKISGDINKAEDYYNLIKKYSNSDSFIAAAKEKLDELSSSLNKGDESTSFAYENVEGKKVKLEDFKGKLIYIDVWATWCAPCKKQIPYLKKLEKHFSGQNIVFISISVDKKRARKSWEKMVKNEGLEGIQLFADNSFDSEFIKAYGISSIPRFIIIDQDGKVYDPKAPRPSYDKTKLLLESLLK